MARIPRPFPTAALLAFLFAPILSTSAASGGETWGERLGYPPEARVLILHADDVGLTWEANVAAARYFEAGRIQSASLMAPCPWFDDAAAWARENPRHDLGVHLTLNAEWDTYRWGPTAPEKRVSSLLDSRRLMLRSPVSTFLRSSSRHVKREIRAQVECALAQGLRPTHLDTHIGTLLTRSSFIKAYLDTSRRYGIPAMTFRDVETSARCVLHSDFPFKEQVIDAIRHYLDERFKNYPYPQLDVFCSMPKADTYEEKREKLFALVRSLPPGITQIIFHPALETEGTRAMMPVWQQRAWEAELFHDPEVHRFFAGEGVLFTTWREMMARFTKGK